MRYFKKIAGGRVYLSPVNPADAELYVKWLNDPDVAGYLGNFTRTVSLVNEPKFLEKLASEDHNFAIVLTDGDKLIGNISLMDVNLISRRAAFGVFIGETEYRSRGYGTEAIRLLLAYGFDTLNLHNIMLMAHSDNERAIACYKKVGFSEFGRHRESKFKGGRYIDTVYMDILESEFVR